MTGPAAGYIDSHQLTTWTQRSLYAQIAIAIVALISGLLEYQLINAFEGGTFASQAEAVVAGDASDARQRAIGIVQFGIYIVSGILILKWIYRANHNASQLGAHGLEFTPGWSIGWYFVPIANLWKPYQAMKEIWQASTHRSDWRSQAVPGLLGGWWFLWLVSNAFGNAALRLSLKADELSEFRMVNILTQLSDTTGIVLALVLLAIVQQIHAMQLVAHEQQRRISVYGSA